MCPRIIQAVCRGGKQRCNAAAHQNYDGSCQTAEDCHLHFKGFNLFAQIFRRTPDHQACDKYGQDGESKHTVEPAANTAEHDFAKHHKKHRYQAAYWRIGIMHGVYGTIGSRRCPCRPCGRGGNTEPCFLSFHIAACRSIRAVHSHRAVLCQLRRSLLFIYRADR